MAYRSSQQFSPFSHHLKCYHRTLYQDETTATLETTPVSKRVGHFVCKGIEKSSDRQSLVYGSGASYSEGNSVYQKTSGERLKRLRQQLEAEADIARHHKKKELEEIERIMQQHKDLEMLKEYQPWGKPAAGAPLQSPSGSLVTRKRGLQLENTSHINGEQSRDVYYPFGRPGAGAPCRTDSGTVITGLPADPDVRFQKQLKKEVDRTLRYKKDGLLEPAIYTPAQPPPMTPEMEQRMKELEKKQLYAQKLEDQWRESEQKKLQEKAFEKNSYEVFDPWGKNAPVRDASGKIVSRCRAIAMTVPVQDEEEGGGGGDFVGQLNKLREEGKKKRIVITNKGYDPWGKPGAGAPLASQSGQHITTAVFGKFTSNKHEETDLSTKEEEYRKNGQGLSMAMWMRGHKLKVTEDKPYHTPTADMFSGDVEVDSDKLHYRTELQQQAEARRRQLRIERDSRVQGEIEHVTRMSELWPPSNYQLKRTEATTKKRAYYSDLQQMMEDRLEAQRLERKRELESEIKHVQAFDEVWGRPGGGAPRVSVGGAIDTSHNTRLMSATTNRNTFRRV